MPAIPPALTQIHNALNPHSPPIRQTAENLTALYRQTQSIPPVANSYQAWTAHQPSNQANPQTFIRQTAQSLLYRLIAYRFLNPRPTENDLPAITIGDWFAAQNWNNLLTEDCFSWPYYPLSMNLSPAPQALTAAQTLLTALQPFDFTPAPPAAGAPPGAPPPTGGAPCDPLTPTLAPHCGPGSVLAQAVRAAAHARQTQNQDPLTALLETSHQFLAITPDPLDANAAALNFLTALGPLARQPHPPILIPVYQAHPDRIPQPAAPSETPAYAITLPGITHPPAITLPATVAADPLYLDWLLSRLPNYQRGAALRLHAQPPAQAIQEVLNAWYNYLTSPKARTPIPQPLTPTEADIMVETARALITAHLQGAGPAPLHQARNAPAPLFPARRPYPQTLQPPPTSPPASPTI